MIYFQSSFLFCVDKEEDTFKPGISALTARSIAILRHIPFSVPFLQRVKVGMLFFPSKITILLRPLKAVAIYGCDRDEIFNAMQAL